MFDKINQLKKQMEDIKNRLETITVKGESADKKVVVTMNGNKKVTDVFIDTSLSNAEETEELQDFLIIAFNRAMEQAERVNEAEMRSVAGGLLPGLGF